MDVFVEKKILYIISKVEIQSSTAFKIENRIFSSSEASEKGSVINATR